MSVRTRPALLLAVVAFGWMAAGTSRAAEPSPAFQSELSRIFEKRDYTPASFGPARWLDEGRSYTTLEASSPKEPGSPKEIVSYETASGRREVLVPAAKLVHSGAAKPLSIDDYAWSPGRPRLLVFTNTKKVWRTNTRGDHSVLELATGALRNRA